MKTILYICESYMEYEQQVINLIEKELNYNCIYIDLNKYEYNYKNLLERFYGKTIYPLFFKENYKKRKTVENIIKDIEKLEKKIDIIFYIRPTIRMKRLLKYLKEKNIKMISHQWDSLKKVGDDGSYIKYFDKNLFFDKQDAIKYNGYFLPNFYIKERVEKLEEEYDIYTIISHGKHGNRIEQLEEIAKNLKEKNIKFLFLVYTKEKNIKSEYLTIIDKPISLKENYNNMLKSKVILEIGDKKNQGGLTFRAIDSLGLKKKLVTNYDFVKEYDFYNPKNIYILRDENIEIPVEFFEQEYEEVDKKIYEKYSGKSWIKNIFMEE